MITRENITIYQCEYCKKNYFREHACIKHEKFCVKNPENFKACDGCVFLEHETIEWTTHHYYESERMASSNGFRCTKKDILLYPTKVERLDLPNRYPETFEDQEPMPKECEFKEHKEFLI